MREGEELAMGTSWWQRIFESLQERDFRLLWLSMLPGTLAMQMGFVTNSYLAYDITGSAAAVGLVTLGFGVPMLLLSVIGGVVADRFPKRQVLMVTHGLVGLAAAILAALVLTGVIQIWHMAMVTMMMGTAFAFNMPARQAFVAELVGRERLTNAIAINNTGLNLARVFGPALAGALIGVPFIGIGGVCVIMTGMYAIVVWTISRLPDRGVEAHARDQSGIRSLIDGLRYIWGNAALVALMLLTFAPVMLGMSYQSLMPVFSEAVFRVGPGGLGFLLMMNGIGAVIGSLVIASCGTHRRRGLLLVGLGMLWGGALAIFAFSQSFVVAMFVLPFIGGASAAYMTLNMSLMMDHTDPAFHGRVMSVSMLTFSVMPLSVMPTGALVDVFGAPMVIGLCGLLLLAVVFLYGALHSPFRNL